MKKLYAAGIITGAAIGFSTGIELFLFRRKRRLIRGPNTFAEFKKGFIEDIKTQLTYGAVFGLLGAVGGGVLVHNYLNP